MTGLIAAIALIVAACSLFAALSQRGQIRELQARVIVLELANVHRDYDSDNCWWDRESDGEAA